METASEHDFLREAVADAVVESGIEMTPEQSAQLTDVLTERVAVAICMELIAGLNDAQAAAIAQSVQTDGNPRDIIQRLQAEMPDFAPRVAGAFLRTYDDIKKDLASAAGSR